MTRCVIVAGAKIENYDRIKSFLTHDDYFVFCDSGLYHKQKLGVIPDFIVGDFDSADKPKTNKNILILPTVKDDTDTFAAIKLMLEKGFKEFLLIGVIGERLDHTFGNVSILLYLKEQGAKGVIIDDYSQMLLVENKAKIKHNSCSYFSLISLSDSLTGVDIKGAKYPLENATINSSFQYAISNETVEDTEISVQNGNALLIKVF